MDPDRPTSSYRTPAAEAAPPASEVLAAFNVPSLGALRLELGLGAPIRLSLDREELRLTPGSGLRVRSDGLPPLLINPIDFADLYRRQLAAAAQQPNGAPQA